MSLEVVNIAAYKFFNIPNLLDIRTELRRRCVFPTLKGTILLSTEGINMFLSGSRQAIDEILAYIRTIPGCEDLQHKESFSEYQPFVRMLVKIKKEIIPFAVEGIDPGKYTSRKLPAEELKKWLDEGKEVVLLDTRNDYEVEAGTFKNATILPLDDFRNFPKRIAEIQEQYKDRPIVTFCTGGIRCEKAAPYLERVGFKDVYQLEGGILKYFELCGGAHYDGGCFVFDKRHALDPKLQPIHSTSQSV